MKEDINNPLNIQDEFLRDLYKQHKKLEVFEYDDIEAITKDFAAIIEYDNSVSNQSTFYYSEDCDIQELSKIEVMDKDAYIAKRMYKKSYDETTITMRLFSLFMKINLNKRLHIHAKQPFLKIAKDTYEKSFFDPKEELKEFDLKNCDELKEALSEEFYFQKFSADSEYDILELDDYVKQKLLEIFNKYNILFKVVIKDNLLRLEIELPTGTFESEYSILYNIEKTFEEVLDIFLNLERVNDNIRFNNIGNNYSNVKNLIFDLDNTIIFDTDADSEYYRDALINSGYSDDYFYGIYQVIDDYDKSITEDNPYYNKREMLDFINESLQQNFSLQVIDEIQKVVGKEWTKRILISKDVLEYLSSKYNLYIYTNYYQEAQTERIKNIGYDKYFKKIFGADKYGCKQFKKCFEKVLKEIGAKPEECIMIGDAKSRDIVAANNMNMKSILFDYNGRRDKKEIVAKDYFVIKDMNELKRIL